MSDDRKNYHHGSLEDTLLSSGRAMVEASGASSLSLRACARQNGVDVAAVYRHYRSKHDLLVAITAGGFQELSDAMGDALATCSTSVERFQASGRAYLRYGTDHPHLYRLMFGGECQMEEVRARRPEGSKGALGRLEDLIQALAEEGLVDPRHRDSAVFIVWSSVHGLVSLCIDGRGAEDLNALSEDMFDVLLAGLNPDKK